jgi:DNA-directed RNA polymerase specialized sigma24 family protein
MQRDHFPSTHANSMMATASEGPAGLSRARAFVMDRYRAPLLAYVRGSSLRTLEDAEELVHAYFATRLAREDFFERWRASGLPFRRWLMNGIHFCARERRKDRVRMTARETSGGDTSVDGSAITLSGAERAFERELASRVIDACTRIVQHSLAGRGLASHWDVFWRRSVDGQSYAAIAAETRMPIRELNAAVRGVTAELRAAIRAELVREGVDDESLDFELSRMEESLRP